MSSTRSGAPPAAGALLAGFLAWVEREPRSYTEAMEAWRSSCPRFTIWEDAIGDSLIEIDRSSRAAPGQAQVALTPRGKAVLAAASINPRCEPTP